jgi:MFS family permease
MIVLITSWTIQGIGGGGLEALAEIILTDITTLVERPLYVGILGFVWAAGSAFGPLISGMFAEYSSWRWIAWINLHLSPREGPSPSCQDKTNKDEVIKIRQDRKSSTKTVRIYTAASISASSTRWRSSPW